jgi:3-oxoacyl-[acyl-carrier-protein] synthase II
MSAERPRVVVTGLGAITPLALSAEETWQGLIAGRSGVDWVTQIPKEALERFPTHIAGEVKGFDPRNYMEFRDAKRMGRFSQFAVACSRMALQDAGLKITPDMAERVGVLIGLGMGGMQDTENAVRIMIERGPMHVSPFYVVTSPANMATFWVAYINQTKGYTATIVGACASGTQSVGEATEVIRRGAADVMLAGGVEAGLCELALASFCTNKGYTQSNDPPQKASRPFDKNRDGFIGSEGCGMLVLESLEHARQRGARIYAEILGYGASNDAFHLIAPDPEGAGAARAMRWALKNAGVEPSAIQYINAHATSTPLGDAAETKAIKSIFGERAYKIPVSATKSMLGHMMGGAGAVEAIATILSIRDDIVHPTINYETPDPECDLDCVPNVARKVHIDKALSNSFGLGGQNASIVIGRYAA